MKILSRLQAEHYRQLLEQRYEWAQQLAEYEMKLESYERDNIIIPHSRVKNLFKHTGSNIVHIPANINLGENVKITVEKL